MRFAKGTKEWYQAKVRAYISEYADLAVRLQHKYGVPASISLAQGILESKSGESTLTRLTDNHFGIKCMKKRCRHDKTSTHCMNFSDDTPHDRFRIYDTAEQSWESHAKIVTRGRYEWLTECGINYRTWAAGLQDAGYATDKKYAKQLVKLIEDYGLDRYDKIYP